MQRTHLSVAVIGFALLLASAAAFLVMVAFADDADARARYRIVTRTFSNPSKVTIPAATSSGVASPYPSEIAVGGFRRGSIRDVNVKINGLTDKTADPSWIQDVDLLLVAPGAGGKNAIILSDAGGATDSQNVNFSLNDEAAAQLGPTDPINGLSYKPTNVGSGDTFPAPAPTPSGNTALSTFDFTNPNGIWRLYVVDDATNGDTGEFTGGWSLEIKARVLVRR